MRFDCFVLLLLGKPYRHDLGLFILSIAYFLGEADSFELSAVDFGLDLLVLGVLLCKLTIF